MRTFLLLSLASCISTVGSQLMAFALGVWIYPRTGSITVYALTGLMTQVPLILAAPLAGALVDRWGFLRAIRAQGAARPGA